MTYRIQRIPNYEHEARVLAERHRQGIAPRNVQRFPWERERRGQGA